MNKQCISAPKAPPAAGPYSHAVRAGGFIYVSGQVGIEPGGGGRPDSFDAEARQMLENLKAVLEGAGTSLDKVVKTTVFVTDMDRFAELNAIYGEVFGSNPPARSCVEVSRLPLDSRVEIEAVALAGD